MKTPRLETERLILTPRCAADNPALQILIDDWDIMKNMSAGNPWPYPADGMETYWRDHLCPAMAEGRQFGWAIRLKDDPDTPIGQILLLRDTPEDNRGFWIGREYWGRGITSEAAATVTKFWFEDLGEDVLFAPSRADNAGSNRIKEKQGFTPARREMRPYADGELYETILWRLTAEDYKARLKARHDPDTPNAAPAAHAPR